MPTDSNPNNSINMDIEDAINALQEHGNAIQVDRQLHRFVHIYTYRGKYYTIELHYKWYKDLDDIAKTSVLNFTRNNDDNESIELMQQAYQSSVWPTGGRMEQSRLISGCTGARLFYLKVVVKPL